MMMGLRASFFALAFAVASVGAWSHPGAECQGSLVKKYEDAFVEALEVDPLAVYNDLRRRALEAKAAGQKTFNFPEMIPTIGVIQEKIRELSLAKDLTKEEWDRYFELNRDSHALLSGNVPYHDFIRWSMRFIEHVDSVFRRRNPKFTSYYHQNLAKNVVEDLLAKWPDVLAFPSFQAVGIDFFHKTRVVPVHLVGFTTEAIFGDGFDLTPAEFAYHDWGHIEFLSLRDIDHLTDPYFRLSSTLLEWRENRDAILSALAKLQNEDPDLFRGVNMTLFEVLHERGYPYDLFRLKAQFETTKWTEILFRKLTNNFWKNLVFTEQQLSRLHEGREWLLALTRKLIEERNTERIQSLRAHESPVRVRYTPPVKTFQGIFTGAYFNEEGKIFARFKSGADTKSCGLMDVSLAQISNEGAPDFSQETIAQLEKLLWVQWKGARLELKGDASHVPYRLSAIEMNTAGGLEMLVRDARGDEKRVAIVDVVIPYAVSTNEFVIKDVEIYKLRQLLALHASGREATFIEQRAQESFEGKLLEVSEASGMMEARIEVLAPTNEVIRRPLSDLSFYADGPLLFQVGTNQLRAEEVAAANNFLLQKPNVKIFPSGNTLYRLQGDVSSRSTTVLMPAVLSANEMMEALIAVRTLRTNGADHVDVMTSNGNRELEVAGAEDVDWLGLLQVAGAKRFRMSENRFLKTSPPQVLTSVEDPLKSHILSIRSDALGNEISQLSGIPLWTEDELPRDSMVYLVMDGGFDTNAQLIQAFDKIVKLKFRGNKVALISPYLPYARSDKVDEAGGVTVTGRLVADLLEALGLDSIIFMRAHAPQSQGFFKIASSHLSGRPTLIPVLKALGVERIIAPDEGAMKAASLYAKDLGVKISTANKQRDPLTQKTSIWGLSDSQVQGQVVAIVDDELDTGGTAAQVADLLYALGAKEVYVVTSHMTGDGAKILAHPRKIKIILTNSVANPSLLEKGIDVVSAAREIAERVKFLERARLLSVER
jgi:ribose-phosphate pyrophosphokinase